MDVVDVYEMQSWLPPKETRDEDQGSGIPKLIAPSCAFPILHLHLLLLPHAPIIVIVRSHPYQTHQPTMLNPFPQYRLL